MPVTQSRPDLAATLGFLNQTRAEGELVLVQYDGTRRFYFKNGDLSYLRSDAVGEQFGNYLIRLGVLDYSALKDLLSEDGARVGDRVVQWGLLTEEQRDKHLRELFKNILLHAVEHPVLNMTWNPGSLSGSLGQDLQFHLDHRRVVWDVYRQMQTLGSLVEKFESESDWKWRSRDGLLDALADLTLTPMLAFAISQLGREPMNFSTFMSLTGLEESESARLLAALWALGGLELDGGDLSSFLSAPKSEPAPAQRAEAAPPPQVPVHKVEEVELEAVYLDESESMPRMEMAVAPVLIPLQSDSDTGGNLSQAKARVLFHKAEGFVAQARTSEAVRTLEQAIKLDPDSPSSYEIWMMLGDLRQGNPAWSTRAIEAYQAAARAKPKMGKPWFCMGQLYHRKGFGTNAMGCFRKAVELDPSLEIPDQSLGLEPPAAPKGGVMDRLRGLFGGDKK